MDKIVTIIGKEWSEVFKNRLVLMTVLSLPLAMAVLPLIMVVALQTFPAASSGGMSELDVFGALGESCAGLSELDCTIVYMLNLFVLLFMIVPIAIPVTIAAYSIVGEKTNRSLEPLLATPITTTELLVAKIAAAVLPAIAATWLGFLLFLVGVRLLATDAVFDAFFEPQWLIAIFVVAPLLGILSVCIAIIISSRVTDPRVAEQMSALIVLPLILLIVGQSIGLILIDRRVMMIILLVVGVLDVFLLFLATRLFQRETILTRWK